MERIRDILVAGAGPAGAAAAIAAMAEGARVRMVERSVSIRLKVCGEFLSPGTAEALAALGVWDQFCALGPSKIRRCALHLGNHTKEWALEDTAWGLSRTALDGLMAGRAEALGADLQRGAAFRAGEEPAHGPVVLACGRSARAQTADRLFGFKAHFSGSGADAVELFFGMDRYVGVNAIEAGLTNVCGLARESELRRCDFRFDDFAMRSRPLASRLDGLKRVTPWVAAGPLEFYPPQRTPAGDWVYPAGDALSFVDPFTGCGIMNALITGRMAGLAAARGLPVSEYLGPSLDSMRRAFRASSFLRRMVAHREFQSLAPYVPGNFLLNLTRGFRR